MMRRVLQSSNLVGAKGAFLVIIGMAALVGGAAKVYSAAQERSVTYSFLDEALAPVVQTQSLIEWNQPVDPRGRAFRDADQQLAGLALTNAWAALTLSTQPGASVLLDDYFDGVALDRASEASSAFGVDIEQATVSIFHEPTARFFHLDGSSLAIESNNHLIARYVLAEGASEPSFFELARECTRQILLRKPTGWKISFHERQCSEAIDLNAASSLAKPNFDHLKGVNYYRSDAAWLHFWASYDGSAVRRDFDRMNELGANSFRFFIPFDRFTDVETRDEAIADLTDLMTQAKAHGLSVIPTLFDFRGDYAPARWAEDYAHLRTVLGVLKPFDNIAYVDLKNEADLDFKPFGEAHVTMWLKMMLTLARLDAPELAYSVGWSTPDAASIMAEQFDVISYHEFKDPKTAGLRLTDVKKIAGSKPVVVSEVGFTSWSLFNTGFPSTPDYQAQWLDTTLQALSRSNGVLVWSLADFELEHTQEVTALPWHAYIEAEYGLFNREGQKKPSAHIFTNWRN